MATAIVASVALTLAGIASTSASADPTAPQAVSSETKALALDGICGTLLATSTSVVSLRATTLARGAGWLGAIVSSGCLLADAIEYSNQFAASPAGVAAIQGMMDQYRGYTFEDYMVEFGCKYEEGTPPPGTDSAGSARVSAGHWYCPRD